MPCDFSGFALDEVGERPRCRLIVEEGAREVKQRQEMREALFRKIEEFLEHGGDMACQG